MLHAALDSKPDDPTLLQQLATAEYADRNVDEARRLYQVRAEDLISPLVIRTTL